MNKNELNNLFVSNDVPTNYYSFGKPGAGDCFSLENVDGKWLIYYYSERGDKELENTFTSEKSACLALFSLVQKTVKEEQGRVILL